VSCTSPADRAAFLAMHGLTLPPGHEPGIIISMRWQP
jgi:hypothetical protein